MSIYRRIGLRLGILFVLAIGAVSLAQPAKVEAFSCQSDCFAQYQQCRSEGLFGCDTILADCLCSCNGTC